MPKSISILGLIISCFFLYSLKNNVAQTYKIKGNIYCKEKSCGLSLQVKMIYKNHVTKEQKERTTSSDSQTGEFTFTYTGYKGDKVEIIANSSKPPSTLKDCKPLPKVITITPEVESSFLGWDSDGTIVKIDDSKFRLDCTIKP
ncbi:MAG: hypothetical protein P1U70_27580 [Saprospiraceae bacterium]|nr:hypothetical protein [Saprospiraceae bacterium]